MGELIDWGTGQRKPKHADDGPPYGGEGAVYIGRDMTALENRAIRAAHRSTEETCEDARGRFYFYPPAEWRARLEALGIPACAVVSAEEEEQMFQQGVTLSKGAPPMVNPPSEVRDNEGFVGRPRGDQREPESVPIEVRVERIENRLDLDGTLWERLHIELAQAQVDIAVLLRRVAALEEDQRPGPFDDPDV